MTDMMEIYRAASAAVAAKAEPSAPEMFMPGMMELIEGQAAQIEKLQLNLTNLILDRSKLSVEVSQWQTVARAHLETIGRQTDEIRKLKESGYGA